MNEEYDVVETAHQAGNFRILLQALAATGLNETLKERGPYTLLAPIDDAFLKVPRARLSHLFSLHNREILESMLRNHIIAGKALSTALKLRDEIRSMEDEKLRIHCRSGLWVNDAQVIAADVEASNGVLHAIDAVLLPQTQSAAAR